MVSVHEQPASPATPTHRRVRARTRLDFWLDLAIFVGFVVAYSFGFTGPAIHEWWGLAIGAVLLVHLTLQWDWVMRTTVRMFNPRGRDKLIWLVNLALLASMTVCVLSGVLISSFALPEMGISISSNGAWSGLHHLTAELTLILVPIHAALRWRWIVSVARHLARRGQRSR
jgi:Domain of unknown function (DUF4405)